MRRRGEAGGVEEEAAKSAETSEDWKTRGGWKGLSFGKRGRERHGGEEQEGGSVLEISQLISRNWTKVSTRPHLVC